MEITVDLLGRKECFEAPPILTENFLREIYERFDVTIGNLFDSDEKLSLGDDLISREYTLEQSVKGEAIEELQELGIEVCQESLYNEHEDPYIVELLLDAGMILDEVDADNVPKIYKNIYKKNLDVIELLVERGLNINYKYRSSPYNGETLLYLFLEKLEMYNNIDKNIIIYLAEITNDISLTLFYLDYHIDLLKFFIERGVSIYTLYCDRHNLLCYYTDKDCINYVLDLDTERKLDILSVFENNIHMDGYNSFDVYIKRGICPGSEYCIAKLCAGSSYCYTEKYELLKAILKHNKIGLNDRKIREERYSFIEQVMDDYIPGDKEGLNYIAVKKIKLLLKHGADPNIPMIGTKKSILELAREYKDEKLVELLLDYGAN